MSGVSWGRTSTAVRMASFLTSWAGVGHIHPTSDLHRQRALLGAPVSQMDVEAEGGRAGGQQPDDPCGQITQSVEVPEPMSGSGHLRDSNDDILNGLGDGTGAAM